MNGEALTGFYAEYRSTEEGDRRLSFHRLVALPCSLIRPPKNALFSRASCRSLSGRHFGRVLGLESRPEGFWTPAEGMPG